MLRSFISNGIHTATMTRGPGFFLGGRAHGEAASRENDHLRTFRTIPKRSARLGRPSLTCFHLANFITYNLAGQLRVWKSRE